MPADPPADREELCRRAAAKEPFRLRFFWGHRRAPGAPVGPWALSQWAPTPFSVDGVRYPTAEHWIMAGKARLFGDVDAERAILAADTPADAKRLGRKVRGFDDDLWRTARMPLVVRGNVEKFGADAALRAWLLSTGDDVLVEASPTDAVWGIGLAASDPRAQDPCAWPGLNLLGFSLIAARAALRARPA